MRTFITSEQTLAGPREQRPRPAANRLPPAARIALAHGAYLALAGLPALRRGRGAGASLASIGAALAMAGARGKVARELRILGAAVGLSCAALALLGRSRATKARYLDGAAQLAFAGLWGAAEARELRESHRPPEPAFA
jgi:hypothetical protein